MADSNKSKVERGNNNQSGIKDYFSQLKKSGMIKDFQSPFFDGYKEYDEKQFYAFSYIAFHNGENWIVYSTTSYRSDRVKENFWDIINLKNKNQSITKAYLVYPDSIPEEDRKAFRKFSNQVSSHSLFTNLDGVYSFSAFKLKCEAKAAEGKTTGYMHNATGVLYEQKLASALSNRYNLRELKKPNSQNITFDSDISREILEKIGLDPIDIVRIDASADRDTIGLLPTGGQPKTDVIANIELDDGDMETITISCKKTLGDWVTAAQYSANSIADALDPLNDELRRLLNEFQKEGTLSALSDEESKKLENELKPLMTKFCAFVLGGVGGVGNPKTQWAKWLAIFKSDEPDDFEFWSLDEYIKTLIDRVKDGNYGTPFKWTYASGEKGNSIQLKAKVI